MSPRGDLFLIIATDDKNTAYKTDNKRSVFAWMVSKNGYIDLLQMFVVKPAAKVPVELTMNFNTKTAQDGNIIYYHESLKIMPNHSVLNKQNYGMFTSGFNVAFLRQSHDEQFKKIIEFLNSDDCVLLSGIDLDSDERKYKQNVIITENDKGGKLNWHNVHPSDFLENCFDGYGMVDITNLEYLRTTLYFKEWLNISKEEFSYFHEIGMTKFPLIIHPFRLDEFSVSARWKQPSRYESLDNQKILWQSVYTGRCSCGCIKVGEEPSKFNIAIQESAKTKHLMNVLFDNQSIEGKQAAFTKNGIYPIYPGYLTQTFKNNLYDLLRKDDLVLSKEDCKKWKYIQDIKYKKERIEHCKRLLESSIKYKKHMEKGGFYNDQGIDSEVESYKRKIKKYEELPDEVPEELHDDKFDNLIY